jgi:large subunit ribosomal protein L9
MKVILLEDVKGVGKKEQLIEVSPGHARNFLFPKKLAMEATKENLHSLDARRKAEESRRIADIEAAAALKDKLQGLDVKVSVKIGENGRMFGSVTNKEVAEALLSQENIEIDKKKITVEPPVKTLGEHTVDVKLLGDISAKLKITVGA